MLAIVPAKGTSTGVPGKNLRPVPPHNTPLVLHTCRLLSAVPDISRIVVTTDDPTIAALCRLHGYEVLGRPPELTTPEATVQETAAWVVVELDWAGPVGVFQPTSPTLTAATIADAVHRFLTTPEWDSLASVVADHSLLHDGTGAPLFTSYTNRQTTPPLWRRTGGIQLARQVPARGGPLAGAPLVGGTHHLYELPPSEAIDIDTIEDLHAARHVLSSIATVHIHVAASDTIGSGHVRRGLQLAHELDHYDLSFVTAPDFPEWAADLLAPYPILRTPVYAPTLAIFDVLDTTDADTYPLRAAGTRIITLEDLGPGSLAADFVVNELYASGRSDALLGPAYAVLRPEFLDLPAYDVVDLPRAQQRILISFGGTDPSHLTARVARALTTTAANLRVVPPQSMDVGDVFTLTGSYSVAEAPVVMAEEMLNADLLITSCGRTVHEAAAVGIPTIAIAANARESRHVLCPGPIYLGLGATLLDEQIAATADRLLASPGLRTEMSVTMRSAVDGLGARRIAHLAEGLIAGL